jgi:hypothetical protein
LQAGSSSENRKPDCSERFDLWLCKRREVVKMLPAPSEKMQSECGFIYENRSSR